MLNLPLTLVSRLIKSTPANGGVFSLHTVHCLITRKEPKFCVRTILVCKFLAIYVVIFELIMNFPKKIQLMKLLTEVPIVLKIRPCF